MRSRLSLLGTALSLLLLVAALGQVCFSAEKGKPLSGYSVLVIQPFTVSPNLKAAGMPSGYEDVLQKTLFAKLLSERVFYSVVEAGRGIPELKEPGTLIASGEVSDFAKGNRAARLAVGYGVGSAKVKVVMVFRDAVSGAEVLRLERTGRYAGFGNITGGSADKARSESARKVVDGLVKQIKAAR
ncbi:MAG TPA: DUF4410 domain-containing protein [Terriglobales bacterium]|nr:DUF4410 domain-containing protein [Terriglobales bacterium]